MLFRYVLCYGLKLNYFVDRYRFGGDPEMNIYNATNRRLIEISLKFLLSILKCCFDPSFVFSAT